MHNQHACYTRWTWIIAIILGLIILLMLLTGKGLNNTCCHATDAVATEAMPAPPPQIESSQSDPFSFSASSSDFSASGDSAGIEWLNDIDALKALLTGGLTAEGDNQSITLNGSASSEEEKEQIGKEAEAFFGPDVMIDNQISVFMPEPESVVVAPIAKIYFEPGYYQLPAGSQATLEPIITWLNDNLEAKAIISGYHDPTGDLASNQRLAKNRAQSTMNALVNAGIDASRIEMRKPISTDGGGDLNEARRVEVSIE